MLKRTRLTSYMCVNSPTQSYVNPGGILFSNSLAKPHQQTQKEQQFLHRYGVLSTFFVYLLLCIMVVRVLLYEKCFVKRTTNLRASSVSQRVSKMQFVSCFVGLEFSRRRLLLLVALVCYLLLGEPANNLLHIPSYTSLVFRNFVSV